MITATPIFAADSIGKSFGRRTVLTSASMWAWPGAVTALLGRNGSGKSTLMRIGAGMIRPDHGSVRLDGRHHAAPRLHLLAREGLYFLADRSSCPLNATLRVFLDIVEMRFHRAYSNAPGSTGEGSAGTAQAAAEAVGMTHLLDAPIMELSGGESKRADVALAIARKPRVLIADEPFAGISPLDAEEITSAFRLLRAQGCALIVSGHEVPSILDLADEVVWVTSGTTHSIGSSTQALRHDQFCREYLGPGMHHVA